MGRSELERTNALAALRNLAEDADNQRRIAEQGGVPLLVAQLRSGSDARKAFAAGALWHLSAQSKNQVAIADAGGIPALLQLAKSGDEVQRENAMGAIMKLTETKANRARIIQAGGVEVLVGSIQGEDGGSLRPMIQGCGGVLEPDGSFHPTTVGERVEQQATDEAKESGNPASTTVEQVEQVGNGKNSGSPADKVGTGFHAANKPGFVSTTPIVQ
jgi:hypothetical protein